MTIKEGNLEIVCYECKGSLVDCKDGFVICNKCGVYMANDDQELFDVRETKGNVIEIAQGNTKCHQDKEQK